MGALHPHHAPYHGAFHKLLAATEEDSSSPRNSHFDLRWSVAVPLDISPGIDNS
jgi:hypothetical protein